MASTVISMWRLDGTSTLGNELDNEVRRILEGQHGCFNLES
jgi:hypothetical protein